jgi:siderophore synthetase component
MGGALSFHLQNTILLASQFAPQGIVVKKRTVIILLNSAGKSNKWQKGVLK